jgi:hypothetical protein
MMMGVVLDVRGREKGGMLCLNPGQPPARPHPARF